MVAGISEGGINNRMPKAKLYSGALLESKKNYGPPWVKWIEWFSYNKIDWK